MCSARQSFVLQSMAQQVSRGGSHEQVRDLNTVAAENAALHRDIFSSLLEEIEILTQHVAEAQARAADAESDSAAALEQLQASRREATEVARENATLRANLSNTVAALQRTMARVDDLEHEVKHQQHHNQRSLDTRSSQGENEAGELSTAAAAAAAAEGTGRKVNRSGGDDLTWVKYLYNAEVEKSQRLERELVAARKELDLADDMARLDKEIIASLENNLAIAQEVDGLAATSDHDPNGVLLDNEPSNMSADSIDEIERHGQSDDNRDSESQENGGLGSEQEHKSADGDAHLSIEELEVTNAVELLLEALSGKAVSDFPNSDALGTFAAETAGELQNICSVLHSHNQKRLLDNTNVCALSHIGGYAKRLFDFFTRALSLV